MTVPEGDIVFSLDTQFAKENAFINIAESFYRLSTDAPKEFGTHSAIQLLGHAMGWDSVHLIQPSAVHHNTYLLLIGKSTVTRKSTIQNLTMNIYTYDRQLPRESSPERFVEKLAERPEAIQYMGEFSGYLKGMTGRGYMARFVELYNDLHGCPEIYARELTAKKGKDYIFEIKNCYLSLHSTITPKMLKENLTDELTYGGYLPRYITVSGKPQPQPRERLYPEALEIKRSMMFDLQTIVNMDKTGVNFVFTDKALERYNEIEVEAYKHDRILPFVGRYLNYIVSYADILLVSDAIGVAYAQMKRLSDFKHLIQLIKLIDLIYLDEDKKEIKGINYINYIKSNKSSKIPVTSKYVDRAWSLIKPCLEYVETLVDYVELDKPIAKLMDYMIKNKESIHSRAMQYTHLDKKKMKNAVETLIEMEYLKMSVKEVTRKGKGKINKRFYTWIREDE